MYKNTNFHISFDFPTDGKHSLYLEKLADILSVEYDFPVIREHQTSVQGEKDGGLTVAIGLMGVSISAIGTIISALTYWRSQLPKYSVTLQTGEKTITIDTSSPEKLPELISKIESEIKTSETKIIIAKA